MPPKSDCKNESIELHLMDTATKIPSQLCVAYNPEFETPTLDPGRSMDRTSQFWLVHLFEGLLRFNKDGALVPGAASHYKVSDDGHHYRFFIRPDARWHDGERLTAYDFEYSVKRVFTLPQSECRYLFASMGLKGARESLRGVTTELGVHALSNEELELSLEYPNPLCTHIVASQAFFPVQRTQVEREGETFGDLSSLPIGNGPFRVAHREPGRSFSVVRAESYSGDDIPVIKEITAPYLTANKLTTAEMFLRGELHMADKLDRESYALLTSKGYEVKEAFPSSVDFLLFNCRPGSLFSDQRLRQAVLLTLNREELIQKVEGGLPGTNARARIIPDYMPGEESSFCQEYPFDLPSLLFSEAEALIASYLEEHRLERIPPFSIMASNDSERSRVASYLAEYFSGVFKTEVTGAAYSMKERYEREREGVFDISVTGWIPEYNDVSSTLSLFHSKNSMNRGQFSLPMYDSFLERAESSTSSRERLTEYAKAERCLLEAAGIVPLYQLSFLYCQSPELQGVIRRPFGGDPDLRYATLLPVAQCR